MSFVVAPRTGSAGSMPRSVHARPLPQDRALDPLWEYLVDPDVTDVFVNNGGALYVDRGAGAVRELRWHAEEEAVRALAVSLIAIGGRHVDDATPCVDVRWEGGARVHVALPPVACDGTAISIRLPGVEMPSLDQLEARGMFREADRERLEAIVRDRANVLITGATGAGKTTLLGALLSRADPSDRIVTIEDVAELRLEHPHHVRLEARQANLEARGEITLARLVRESLRMRPDRLVLGECRGEEVRELLMALNTGHHGGAGTVHAGSLADVPARLEALGALAGLDERALARQVTSAISVIVHVTRRVDGTRRIAGFATPIERDGRLAVVEDTS